MIEVGSFEAKTHLSALLEKVDRGEEVLITKRGKAIARLVPASGLDQARTQQAITKLRELRKEVFLGDVTWRELRDEGRR